MGRGSNRKKTLLILGGGHDQLPSYIEARRLGFHVVGVDKNEKALAVPYAHHFLFFSTREFDKIQTACRGMKIDGIISPASDASQESLYHLSEFFDTKLKPSWESVTTSINKAACLSVGKRLG